MAMIGELFAAFDSLKSLVEKLAEVVEKGSDTSATMVCVFHIINLKYLLTSDNTSTTVLSDV